MSAPLRREPKTPSGPAGERAGPLGRPALRPALLVASFAGIGYLPLVPGTWGSLAGLALDPMLRAAFAPSLQAAVILVLSVAGIWAAGAAEREVAVKDPSIVVIDEVAGMLITLFWIPVNAMGAALGFVLFRLLDVVKPFPCRRAERWPAGLGIMADDVLAGIYANLLLRGAVWLIPDLLAG